MPDENDWKEYKRLVLQGLKGMERFRIDVNGRLDELTKDVAIIKTQVKQSTAKWALLAGVAAAVSVTAITHFFLG